MNYRVEITAERVRDTAGSGNNDVATEWTIDDAVASSDEEPADYVVEAGEIGQAEKTHEIPVYSPSPVSGRATHSHNVQCYFSGSRHARMEDVESATKLLGGVSPVPTWQTRHASGCPSWPKHARRDEGAA